MPEEGNMAKKIYVGNLNFATTEDALRDLFGQHGAVTSADIIFDRYTGRSRGFGFVEMENAAEADAAISALDGSEFDGRNLRVNEANRKPDRERRDSW
jgi:RNA recognition motif-containing protein